MFNKEYLAKLNEKLKAWDKEAEPKRKQKSLPKFFTVSGVDIDELYTLFTRLFHMDGIVPQRKDPPVYLRVKRFYPAVHHFREAGNL